MKSLPPGVDHLPLRDVEVGAACYTLHCFMGFRFIVVCATVRGKSPPRRCGDDWTVVLNIEGRDYMVLGDQMAHRHLAAAHRWLNATKEEKTRMAEAERNKEGLTFAEWHAASGQVGSSESLVKAWKNGEDPSEYRIDKNSMTQAEAVAYLLPDLSPEERANLVGLVVTRTKLVEVRKERSKKREELEELEKQHQKLINELGVYHRKLTEDFNPYPGQPFEEEH
ncbi:MAG: hypothetical protein OK454_01265 [Thaumarchaeota archaeon]|nr:hypothetical protein [Nitrososphaerota archaeon]